MRRGDWQGEKCDFRFCLDCRWPYLQAMLMAVRQGLRYLQKQPRADYEFLAVRVLIIVIARIARLNS